MPIAKAAVRSYKLLNIGFPMLWSFEGNRGMVLSSKHVMFRFLFLLCDGESCRVALSSVLNHVVLIIAEEELEYKICVGEF